MTKKKHPDDLLKSGRPTHYKPEYCEALIEMMKEGASKAEVCLNFDCSFQTFLDWQAANPEFLEAVNRGLNLSKGKWEQIGREAAFGNCEGFNATSWIFNMKNRFKNEDLFKEKWSDRQEIDHSGKIGLTDLTDSELAKKLEALENEED